MRPASAAAILAFVAWRVGTGPFAGGIRAVDAGALAAASAIGALTTLCCAWRWTIVARAVGIELALSDAVAAYYRSIFLNLTLPGGIVGDVHRGVSHGRTTGDTGRGLRAVAWERGIGQIVQVILSVLVVCVLPSPFRASMPLVAAGLLAATGVAVLAGRAHPRARHSRWARARRAIAGDLHRGVLAPRSLPALVSASSVVALGHAATVVVAARATGSTAPVSRLLPLALLALLVMVLPSVAGWGPREGAMAWVFGTAGLGAGLGVSTAVAYGVMTLVASLPGGLVLIADAAARDRPVAEPGEGAGRA
jgi:uncharacterized membrane protein YbhN (UPF0104 family)